MKRVFCALFTVLFLLFLSGCRIKVKQSENKPHTPDYLQIINLSISGIGLHLPDSLSSDEEMLRLFEKSSGTQVTITRSGSLANQADYLDYLTLLEQSGSLPDLLIFPSLPEINQKNILIDLEKYVAADPEYLQIPAPLREAVAYSVGIPAIPLRYYLEGYFIHSAAFSARNLSPPAFGMSFQTFLSSLLNLAEKKSSLIPVNQFAEIPLWYPAIQKESPTLWGAHDGEHLSCNNHYFKDGVSYASRLKKSCAPKTDAQASSASLLAQWVRGQLGVYYGSTRESGAFSSTGFSIAYAGIPTGRVLIDGDYIGITKNCVHKEEAVALLKWLSYGKAGLQQRYAKPTSLSISSPPLNSDPKLLKLFFDSNPYAGLREGIETIDTSIVKGEDYLSDYSTYMNDLTYSIPDLADQEQTVTQWVNKAINGDYSYDQYADQLDRLVNWTRPEK